MTHLILAIIIVLIILWAIHNPQSAYHDAHLFFNAARDWLAKADKPSHTPSGTAK